MATLAALALPLVQRYGFTVLKNAKTAAQTVQKFRRAPEDLRFTFLLCEALLEAMASAEALVVRQRAVPLLGAALRLARLSAADCRALLDADPGEMEDTQVSWSDWLAGSTEGIKKQDAVLRSQERLARAATALQLALAAAATSLPMHLALTPFAYEPTAFEVAQRRLAELEMGRARRLVLCGCSLWQRGTLATTTSVDKMKMLGAREAMLVVAGAADDDESLYLRLKPCASVEEEEEGVVVTEQRMRLDETATLRRRLGCELPDDDFVEIVGDDAICYEVTPPPSDAALWRDEHHGARSLVLVFQWHSDAGLSAEAVEALLFTAMRLRRAGGGARELGSVYDPAAAGTHARFLRQFVESVGPLEGVRADGTLLPTRQQQRARAAADATSPDLLTPMRGLAVDRQGAVDAG